MLAISPSRLIAARVNAGHSRRETAAVALGMTVSALAAYERGDNTPPGNTLVRIAAEYGVTVESLCTDELAGAR